jgi:hypothetical protein
MNITFGPSAGINCCWGGTSRTQGTLEITVNGSTSSLPFNLNYEDPIPKAKIIEWIQNVLKELETNRHPKEAFQELRSVWVSLCQKKWIRPTTTTEFSLVSPQTQKFLSSMLGIEESA